MLVTITVNFAFSYLGVAVKDVVGGFSLCGLVYGKDMLCCATSGDPAK